MLGLDSVVILLGSGIALGTAMVGYWLGKRNTRTVASLKAAENDSRVVQYTVDNSLVLTTSQQDLIKRTREHAEHLCLGAPAQIQLLQNLCRCIGAKKTLDIGVYTGYSAMSIAMVLPNDGRVVALDIHADYPEIGRPYWQQAEVEKKIDLRIGPAKESLEALIAEGESSTFDFAFIDANKESYDAYYELSLTLLRPGGIISLDNMLLNATVLEENPESPATQALQALAKKIHRDTRVHASFLYLGDGTILAFKKQP